MAHRSLEHPLRFLTQYRVKIFPTFFAIHGEVFSYNRVFPPKKNEIFRRSIKLKYDKIERVLGFSGCIINDKRKQEYMLGTLVL